MIDAAALAAALLGGNDTEVRAHVGHAARVEAFGRDHVGVDSLLTSRPDDGRDTGPWTIDAALAAPQVACALLHRDGARCAVFARGVGDVLERAWILCAQAAAQTPFVGLATPHDPRMSQHAPQVGFAPELHIALAPAHAETLPATVRHALTPAWRATRVEFAVSEAFSSGDAWAALVRVQGETQGGGGGVIQIGAWAIVVAEGERTSVVVDAWEPQARRAAVRPDRL